MAIDKITCVARIADKDRKDTQETPASDLKNAVT